MFITLKPRGCTAGRFWGLTVGDWGVGDVDEGRGTNCSFALADWMSAVVLKLWCWSLLGVGQALKGRPPRLCSFGSVGDKLVGWAFSVTPKARSEFVLLRGVTQSKKKLRRILRGSRLHPFCPLPSGQSCLQTTSLCSHTPPLPMVPAGC